MNISDIAKMAGVSSAAVSRYLNNGYLSEEKKSAIAKVIEETGYIPSSQAQTLRTKKTKLIGVIIPKIDSDSISQVVAGISEVLSKEGYQMILANTENRAEKEVDYINTFKQNLVDGIILLGTIKTPRHKEALRSLSIPSVILGQKNDHYSSIYHDDMGASKVLTTHVIQKGYKKIAYIGVTEKDVAVGQNRLQGFLTAMESSGLTIMEDAIYQGSFYTDNGYTQTPLLLEAHPDLDAIICATDTIALGVIKYLNEHRIKIPDQVAVAGFGDSKTASILNPKLTTIHFYYKECGIEGARILLEQIQNPDTPVKSMQLGFELVENESV